MGMMSYMQGQDLWFLVKVEDLSWQQLKKIFWRTFVMP
jgi:hypothetical protein